MERLRLVPVSPPAFQVPPWLRIEQRGSVALLKALPESLRSELVAQREVSSIGIMFKILGVSTWGFGRAHFVVEAVG